MCVPADVLPADLLESKEPIVSTDSSISDRIKESVTWIKRADAETDPNYKQIIPYVVLLVKPSEEHPYLRWLGYTRAGSEKRLHGQASFGFGGHIEVEDADAESPHEVICRAIDREVEEELGIAAGMSSCLSDEGGTAYIYDPTSDVGRVHLGVLYFFTITEDVLSSIETEDEIASLFLINPAVFDSSDVVAACEMVSNAALETWSRLVMKNFRLFGQNYAAEVIYRAVGW